MSMAKTLTIPTGETVSNLFSHTDIASNYDGHTAIAMIQCPGTLPSITSLGLEFSEDGITFGTVKDEFGAAVSIAVSAGSWVIVAPRTAWRLPKYMRLKSNVAASGGNRAFVLHFRKV